MPTYQYACTDCGDRSEVVQRFTDDPLTVCRACGGKLRKIFSPVGIVFKGSGFYRTDSRKSPSTVSAGKDAGKESSSASTNGSASGGSESKNGSSSESGSSSPASSANGASGRDKKSSSVSTTSSS